MRKSPSHTSPHPIIPGAGRYRPPDISKSTRPRTFLNQRNSEVKCESARVRECESARVRECESARVRECESARVRECETGRCGSGWMQFLWCFPHFRTFALSHFHPGVSALSHFRTLALSPRYFRTPALPHSRTFF